MYIQLEDILKTTKKIHLVKRNGQWASIEAGYELEISITEDEQISVSCSGVFLPPEEDIREAFLKAYSENLIDSADGIEQTEDRNLPHDDGYPYDPEAIRVETKQINVSLVNEMINDGDIDISPDFQRNFVWTDITAKSRLIESIMLRIPLPVFYLSQDAHGSFQVVDGLQRLTVINQFLSNGFRLKNLEYLHEEEGKHFKVEDPDNSLSGKYRKRIQQTQLLLNIIDPQTPNRVKFDIFKRINQGGRPLNSQEMRNSLSSKATRSLIKNLSGSQEFLDATGGSISTSRMQDQEMVLRFLAFAMAKVSDFPSYAGNMERYLDDAISSLNKEPELHGDLMHRFTLAMKASRRLFGNYAFRKVTMEDLQAGRKRRLINKPCFMSWSFSLAYSCHADKMHLLNDGDLIEPFARMVQEDIAYYDALSYGTNNTSKVWYTLDVAERILSEALS